MGTRQAMNIAARKMPSCVCDWIAGRRTESGCRSGLVEHEQRPEEVLPRGEHGEDRHDSEDGLGHRQHDAEEQRERAGSVDPRRFEDLAGQVVEEPLDEHDVEGARPAPESQIAQ